MVAPGTHLIEQRRPQHLLELVGEDAHLGALVRRRHKRGIHHRRDCAENRSAFLQEQMNRSAFLQEQMAQVPVDSVLDSRSFSPLTMAFAAEDMGRALPQVGEPGPPPCGSWRYRWASPALHRDLGDLKP